MKLVSNFNERFREAFGDRSVTEFAAEIGVSKQAISAYLNGTRKPKEIVTGVIANKLKVSPAWLMGYDVSKKIKPTDHFAESLSPDEQKILSAYRDFNDEGKEKMLAYVNDLESTGRYKKDNQSGVVSKEEDA